MKIVKQEFEYKLSKGGEIRKPKIYKKYAYFVCKKECFDVVFCDNYDEIPQKSIIVVKGNEDKLRIPKVIRNMYGLDSHVSITIVHESDNIARFMVSRVGNAVDLSDVYLGCAAVDEICPELSKTKPVEEVSMNGVLKITVHKGAYSWVKISKRIAGELKDRVDVTRDLGLLNEIHTISFASSTPEKTVDKILKENQLKQFADGRCAFINKELYVIPKNTEDEFVGKEFNEAYEEKKNVVISENAIDDSDIKNALVQIVKSQRTIVRALAQK